MFEYVVLAAALAAIAVLIAQQFISPDAISTMFNSSTQPLGNMVEQVYGETGTPPPSHTPSD